MKIITAFVIFLITSLAKTCCEDVSVSVEDDVEDQSSDQSNRQFSMGIIRKVKGCKIKSRKGDKLSIHYTAYLDTGEEIENTYRYNRGLKFELGKPEQDGGVQKGWAMVRDKFKVYLIKFNFP